MHRSSICACHNLVIRGEYFMNDLLLCKKNLKMFPCQSSETRRRLGNAEKVPRIITLITCGRGAVTSVSIRHELWALHHPVQCLRLLWGREGNTHELSIENSFSNRSTRAFETAWEFAFAEPSIFIAEWSRYNMLQCIFHMFSDLHFVSISRLFPYVQPIYSLFI